MATYYLAANFKSPYMPWVAFAGLMGHMLYLHAYRELFPKPGVVDITGAQMVLVMKVGVAFLDRKNSRDWRADVNGGIVDFICVVCSRWKAA